MRSALIPDRNMGVVNNFSLGRGVTLGTNDIFYSRGSVERGPRSRDIGSAVPGRVTYKNEYPSLPSLVLAIIRISKQLGVG